MAQFYEYNPAMTSQNRFATAVILEVCETASWGSNALCHCKRQSRWKLPGETWKDVQPIQVRAMHAFMEYLVVQQCRGTDYFLPERFDGLISAIYKFLERALPTVNSDLDERTETALARLFSMSSASGLWTEDVKQLRDKIAWHPLIGLDVMRDFLDV